MSSTSLPPTPQSSAVKRGDPRWRAAFASVAGTTLEWFDYFLYGAMAALVFNKVFFSDLDALTGTIAAFGTFAVGFIARPFGAIMFGILGDKRGRKYSLMATIIVMGIATVAIGLLPTYTQVGMLAPALLTICRIFQGFAAGGEWGGAILLTFENSRGIRRGLMAALPGAGVGIGSLMSTGSVAILTATLSEEDLLAWGWRIPFIASIAIFLVGIYMRRALSETEEFEAARAKGEQAKTPLRELIVNHWRELLIVLGVRVGENGGYYLLGTFVVAYAVHVGADRTIVLSAVSLAFAITIFTIPFFGWVSDVLGRSRVYGFGALVLAIWGWVYFRLIATDNPALIFLAVLVGMVLAYSAMFGAQSALLAELFGVGVRYSGVALGHSVGAIIGGGLAPLIATALLAVPGMGNTLVAAYASAMGIIALVTLIVARPLLNTRRAERDAEARELVAKLEQQG